MSIEKTTINGKDYTMSEARELYNELHLIFGEKEAPYRIYPYPYNPPTLPAPFNPLEFPYPITCEGESVQRTTGEYFLDPSMPMSWTNGSSN